MSDFPHLFFATPKKLPDAAGLPGRVAVLDLGFCAQGLTPSFENMTGPFLARLGERLCAYVDHHDHSYHVRYHHDPRFVLASKDRAPACAPMVTSEVVRLLGPADTLLCHLDFDGLYSAARWILEGEEPYEGADADAVAVDTRSGELTPIGRLIDRALRAKFQDTPLKIAVIRYLTTKSAAAAANFRETIAEVARIYDQLEADTLVWAGRFTVRNDVAFVHVPDGVKFDKTELLLRGQAVARISVVENSGSLTLAAGFHSDVNFLDLFDLGGGMPTRVTIPSARKAEVLSRLGF
ncbi:hypothetical protein KKD52_04980 [Myxococcota bacterium]|nr:hypothetical protein [Myxococcota bacterium]MBU1413414.1 hypothetical protein [Myxococcota bacterium]MBU1509693.1 hypothetical protein [Myxococcota bacterium]